MVGSLRKVFSGMLNGGSKYTHYYFSNLICWVGSRQVAAPEIHWITGDKVECDLVVPGAATRRDPTHQIKLLKY